VQWLVANSTKSACERVESPVIGVQLALDSNLVAPLSLKERGKLRFEQHVAAAMSVADYAWLLGIEQSRYEPGYKLSSLRTGYGRQIDPTKISIILVRPPQHWHGGGWCFGLPESSSSSLQRSAGASGTASKLRQSTSLSARWPFAKRP